MDPLKSLTVNISVARQLIPDPLAISMVFIVSPWLLSPPAHANWERINSRVIVEINLSSSHVATFRREAFSAVSGIAATPSAGLLSNGSVNLSNTFAPAAAGFFSLSLQGHSADPEPPSSYDALAFPSSGRTITTTSNQLQGDMTPRGALMAGPGSRASEVRLTATQALSVF